MTMLYLFIGCFTTSLGVLPLHWVFYHFIGCFTTSLGVLPLHWVFYHFIGCFTTSLGVLPLHWVFYHFIGCFTTSLGVLPLHWVFYHFIGCFVVIQRHVYFYRDVQDTSIQFYRCLHCIATTVVILIRGYPALHFLQLSLSCCSSGIVPLTCPLHLSGWLAAKSARLFLDKSYRYNFLSLLGEDPPNDISLESMNTARRKALQAKQEAQQEGGRDVGMATSDGKVNNSEALPPRGEKDGESVATDEVMEVNQDVQERANGSEGAIGDLSEEVVGAAKEMMAADTTKCDKKSELETGDNVEVSGIVGGAGGGADDGTEDLSVDNKYNRTNTEVKELDEGAHTC